MKTIARDIRLRKTQKNKTRQMIWIYLFLLPCLVVFLTFYLIPIISVFITSFTDWDGFNNPKFIGIQNYVKMFGTKGFKESISNLLKWSLLAATLHVGFGVLLAFILYRKPFGWKFTRVVFMIPNVISIAAWAMIYQYVFRNDIGIINTILRGFGGNVNIHWFAQEGYAFWAVTFTWLFYSVVVTLLVMGDLMAIPQALHEAAHIDGASSWQRIFYIDLPLCKNSIGTSVIASITARIAMYEAVKLTTNGASGTQNLPMLLVKGINDAKYGYANVAGVLMILFGFVTLFIINKLFKMNENIY